MMRVTVNDNDSDGSMSVCQLVQALAVARTLILDTLGLGLRRKRMDYLWYR